MNKLLEIQIPGQYIVILSCSEPVNNAVVDDNPAFQVVYGREINRRLTYTQAANTLGSCVMHALACNHWEPTALKEKL